MSAKRRENELPSLIIVTGLSGSGMSSATDAFEDLGYFCVDNLPVTMVSTFGRLMVPDGGKAPAIERAVLVINIRERHFLDEFSTELRKLSKRGLIPYILFFDASDEVLQRRFSETRRPHPADHSKGLAAAIKAERRAMTDVKRIADRIIDTSELTVHSLRHLIVQTFSGNPDNRPMKVNIVSFGHKFGAPRGLDLMFDVRHLPNPFFVKELKHLPGSDPAVVKFLKGEPEVTETIERVTNLLEYLLPKYQREGKSYLTIGVGCTGGKHRSVMAANSIGKQLKKLGFPVSIEHRDVQK
ncbi:MAG: RNase adapter RapZ [Acidobacteria bacterium]|nr:RNase adapter RapZ [Acidobacteriota bacterium]MCW5950581.1 RNase adapter RapZ [Pyrinomonadaceae bacterium]